LPRLDLVELESARSNLELKSHIASRISRKVQTFFALVSLSKGEDAVVSQYPMIVGSKFDS